MTVGGASIPGQTIRSVTLPEVRSSCVKVLQGAGQTDYAVCTDVLFAFNRANVRPAARAVLRQVARSLASRFPHARIEVDGHTDARGAAAYNQRLSTARARAVARVLTGLGIARSRVVVRGFGETRPVAPNRRADGSDNPAGRKRNRRVVVGALR